MSSLLKANFLLVNASIIYLKFRQVYKKVFYADSFKGKKEPRKDILYLCKVYLLLWKAYL